jgi:hypothetical protein
MSLKPTVAAAATDVADDDEEEGALERTASANPSLLHGRGHDAFYSSPPANAAVAVGRRRDLEDGALASAREEDEADNRPWAPVRRRRRRRGRHRGRERAVGARERDDSKSMSSSSSSSSQRTRRSPRRASGAFVSSARTTTRCRLPSRHGRTATTTTDASPFASTTTAVLPPDPPPPSFRGRHVRATRHGAELVRRHHDRNPVIVAQRHVLSSARGRRARGGMGKGMGAAEVERLRGGGRRDVDDDDSPSRRRRPVGGGRERGNGGIGRPCTPRPGGMHVPCGGVAHRAGRTVRRRYFRPVDGAYRPRRGRRWAVAHGCGRCLHRAVVVVVVVVVVVAMIDPTERPVPRRTRHSPPLPSLSTRSGNVSPSSSSSSSWCPRNRVVVARAADRAPKTPADRTAPSPCRRIDRRRSAASFTIVAESVVVPAAHRGIDGRADGGAIPVGDWLRRGLSLRGEDRGDLSGGTRSVHGGRGGLSSPSSAGWG